MNKAFILLFYSLCYFLLGQSQTKYNNNWYFGAKAALDFNTNPPTVKTDNKMSSSGSCASVSDEITGELLFYTNGGSFYNRLGELIDSSLNGSGSPDVIIIPLKKFKNRFMVFNFTASFIIDMTAKNGRGAIIEKKNFKLRTSINRLVAVKHCLSESYWLITIENTSFFAYLVHPDGSIDNPVITNHSKLLTTSYIGDFISSNSGDKLALTCYATNTQNNYLAPQIFKFNKRCGSVDLTKTALTMLADWDRPHGVAFSPDDKLIYVSYGYQRSQLVQYDTTTPNTFSIIATSNENFNQIACGPDGKLYISTHINGIPSNKLDVVMNPNIKGSGCNYIEDYLRLSGATNFEMPNLISNHSGTCQENSGYLLNVEKGNCTNTPITFSFTGAQSGIDSIKWFFKDSLFPNIHSLQFNTQYTYKNKGNYLPYAITYACKNFDTTFFKVSISEPQIIQLGKDTSLCYGDSLTIGNPQLKGAFSWNTGDTTAIKKVKQEGLYVLSINNNGCTNSDSIRTSYYLQLQTLLGDSYFICEDEKELVELDAGKGFKHYLWYPTNDTTQWIEVNKKGNYYLVVRDYRGCEGDDKAIVNERCDFQVYIPNAFSPNTDGLNDTFNINAKNATLIEFKVFSPWGELLFEGNGSNGWDGTFKGAEVPQSVYLVKIKVVGFQNKALVSKYYTATLHLIK
ncbi:MAG: gliding motility-associated C-terminal domain-containing protein [bacterium]|nr:gliding motility-associated C-terminal domain-containing protein [bacterium]